MRPDDDNEIRFTGESSLIVTKDALMFLISHTLTVLSSEPETSFSSFVNAALVILLKLQRITFF
jgi:hypothetical protein